MGFGVLLVVGAVGAAAAVSGPPAATTMSRDVHQTRITGWSATALTMDVGERFTTTVRLAPNTRRPYQVLVRRDAKDWKVVQRGKASAKGRIKVRYTPSKQGTYRIKVRLPRHNSLPVARTSARRILAVQPTPTPTPTPQPTNTSAPWSMTAYAVGDIGWCGGSAAATAALIPSGGTVLALGDLAYLNGTPQEFTDCYLPAYGSLLDTTFPVPGNHEYNSGAVGYFDVFGSRVGTQVDPWYSFTRDAWSFYQVNSNCSAVGGCGAGSRQYEWLSAQLAADTNSCIAVSWHHPRWSASRHGPAANMADLYALAASHGADLLLTGHEHNYQRFARLNASGAADPQGIREFVVGTGGAPLYALAGSPTPPLPEFSDVTSFGVLKLDLTSTGYSWRFLATDGSVPDSGSDSCS